MSIADSTGTSRTLALAARSGFDATYVCTNPPSTDATIKIVDRQTRPSKKGGINSALRQVVVRYVDPDTSDVFEDIVNITFRFRNDAVVSNLLLAFALAVRGIDPADNTTMIGEAVQTNLANIRMGVMPTP